MSIYVHICEALGSLDELRLLYTAPAVLLRSSSGLTTIGRRLTALEDCEPAMLAEALNDDSQIYIWSGTAVGIFGQIGALRRFRNVW